MEWPGWRRHGPAAGSVAAHIVVAVVITAALAAAGHPVSPLAPMPEKATLEVALVAESLPVPSERAPEAPRPAPSPRSTDAGDAPPARKDQRPQPVTSTPAPEPTTGDTVYLGPSPFARPAPKGGLEGLATNDPCMARVGIKPKDCATNWKAAVGSMDSAMPRSKQELQRYHADFMTPCPWKVGCEPTDGVLNNGARSFGRTSPMASGAGGVQGINELVGRRPQKPDFVDPGFGD
ncbi:MAG: hypothetical protein Q8R82_13840 [Hyphomonadaceae bacterium]|nr:hypothetical protein [Hyphomonadaceae bacterium]